MMEIPATIKAAAAVVTSLGVIGGGAVALDARHTLQTEFDEYVSSNRVQTILQLADQSKDEGSPQYLCRALNAEIIALCTERPDHYFCTGQEGVEAQKEIKAKAGCR